MYNLFMDADLAQAILESVKPLRSTLISAIPDTLLLLGICTIAYLFTPLTTFHSGLGFDGRFYAAMADRTNSDPLYYLHAPWCWRVLTPSIAALLPFSTISSYQIIAFITCLASLMLLRSILEQQGFESKWQWYGIALYSGVFWTLRWSF